jgi:hypothetical protein
MFPMACGTSSSTNCLRTENDPRSAIHFSAASSAAAFALVARLRVETGHAALVTGVLHSRAPPRRGAEVVAASMSKPLSSPIPRGRRSAGPHDLGRPKHLSGIARSWLAGVPLNDFGAGLSQAGGVWYCLRHVATRGPAVARPAPLRHLRSAPPTEDNGLLGPRGVFRRGAGAVRPRVPAPAPAPVPVPVPVPVRPRATPRPSAASPPSTGPACGRPPPGRSSSAPARRA